MSNGFLDIFIIMTCLSQNKAKFKYLAIAEIMVVTWKDST